jgi:RimJ/RimL family protein N-acetyltransferase
MYSYKVLSKKRFSKLGYSIEPLRLEDRYLIMKWRNEQIYHLRQTEPLTKEAQDKYFKNVISILPNEAKPEQILFSYLYGSKCIGYGGLVHINWDDHNAEISFIMSTKLENKYFDTHWTTFLNLIEKVAFEEIKLHKIFVYAFDVRPKLYNVLTSNQYFKDATLKEHVFFKGGFRNVLIYSKIGVK